MGSMLLMEMCRGRTGFWQSGTASANGDYTFGRFEVKIFS
jgi:hypothetical protein